MAAAKQGPREVGSPTVSMRPPGSKIPHDNFHRHHSTVHLDLKAHQDVDYYMYKRETGDANRLIPSRAMRPRPESTNAEDFFLLRHDRFAAS